MFCVQSVFERERAREEVGQEESAGGALLGTAQDNHITQYNITHKLL